MEVTPEQYETLRSVNVVSEGDIPPASDTQDWRLEAIAVESHVQEQIAVGDIDETTEVGVVPAHFSRIFRRLPTRTYLP